MPGRFLFQSKGHPGSLTSPVGARGANESLVTVACALLLVVNLRTAHCLAACVGAFSCECHSLSVLRDHAGAGPDNLAVLLQGRGKLIGTDAFYDDVVRPVGHSRAGYRILFTRTITIRSDLCNGLSEKKGRAACDLE